MPTYNYSCKECQHTFEDIYKIDDRHIPTQETCPKCQLQNSIELTLSSPNLVSPFRIDGLKKPSGQFKERMAQIKHGLRHVKHNLKD
jgi:putative FmdB family regulatory protein